MTYENIKIESKKGLPDASWVQTIDPFVKPLVEQLALKYPQWTFEAMRSSYNHTAKAEEFYHFRILDKREELGIVGKDWTGRGYRFLVDNHRIDTLRERGSGMKTIHLDKAIKYVSKYFSRKNIGEKLREASQLARTNLDQVATSKGWKMRELWNDNKISSELQRFIVSNFPDALTMLDPTIASRVEDFPIRFNELQQAQVMVNAMHTNNMHLVLLDGMDYAIQKGSEPPTIKASEQLPDYMRKAIGLLKLVENNQIMQDIGFRVNETTFFVLNKEEV